MSAQNLKDAKTLDNHDKEYFTAIYLKIKTNAKKKHPTLNKMITFSIKTGSITVSCPATWDPETKGKVYNIDLGLEELKETCIGATAQPCVLGHRGGSGYAEIWS